jgi:sulfate adenylyltransferase
MIAPHGGKLTDRVLCCSALQDARKAAASLPQITVDYDTARDAQNIARGVFSPIEGFVGKADLESICARNCLTSGVAWTIPIMLDVAQPDGIEAGKDVCLMREGSAEPLAIMHVSEVFQWDKEGAAKAVFGTDDMAHPGVKGYSQKGDWLVAGDIDLIDNDRGPYADYNLFPAETRKVFEDRGWTTCCAFQTRNVPHAGHETMQKTVLGLFDGLFIQPIIGKKKPGDFQDAVILKAYQTIIEKYFNPERVFLNILPTEMRYAGPKEAIMHAIMRKNYGATHIIIGRDHAGVGNYYGEEEAIEMFDKPEFADLEIKPVNIRGDFWYCTACAAVASNRTCPHGKEHQIPFSGTLIRNGIVDGIAPDARIMRPEVFEVIRSFDNPFVD